MAKAGRTTQRGRTRTQEHKAPVSETLRRLARELRVPVTRFKPEVLQELEAYLRDTEEDPEAFGNLKRQATLILYEHRAARQRASRALRVPKRDDDSWMADDERARARAFNAELGRLALDFGGIRNEEGDWSRLPTIGAFRRDALAGRLLKPKAAVAFMLSDALAFLPLSYFRRKQFPAARHAWRWLQHAQVPTRDGDVVEVVQFELRTSSRVETPAREFSFPIRHVLLRLPFAPEPLAKKQVAPNSVLAELQRIGEELSEHYLWDTAQACWFVLTGELPYPPSFTMRLEGGMRQDHEQYRVNITVPVWARAETLGRMLKAVRARFEGQVNRPLSVLRLEVVDFVAPLRHAGKSWREIAKLWNKSHPGRKYDARNPRNLERDFSDTYELLMRTRVTFRTSQVSKLRNEPKKVMRAVRRPGQASRTPSRPRPTRPGA